MGQFSPNPVSVLAPATARLSAYYTPPSGVPEGQLTATYDWSVTSVQFKYTWLDSTTGKVASYGPPPANSYTDPISPQPQPSANSGATLTSTPLKAGYWEVSVRCSVTVTDATTNQYWTNPADSGNAGLEDLTSYELAISVGTPTVTGGSNLNVCVGEQIPLTAQYGPSDMTLQWTVQGSIITGYTTVNSGPTPKDIDYTKPSTAKIDPVTTADLAEPALTYYWMDTDSGKTENEKVTLAGTLPNGQSPPSPSTTFNVYRPVPKFTTSYKGPVTLVNPYQYGGSLVLYDGGDPNGTGYGIWFLSSVTTTAFGGTRQLEAAQIASNLVVTTKQYDSFTGKTTEFAYGLPSSKLPGLLLDTNFPFNVQTSDGSRNYFYADVNNVLTLEVFDAPTYHVDPPPSGHGFGYAGDWSTENVVVTETFVYNLLFYPSLPFSSGTATTDAPLGQVGWGWGADVENSELSGLYLASWSKTPSSAPATSDLGKLPEWNNNAQNETWGWSDPDWFIVP